MAQIEKLIPIILKWEGSQYTEVVNDLGGPTKLGVTLATWKTTGYDKDGDGDIDKDDIKLLTIDDFKIVLRKYYWNTWKADLIKSQSIANVLVDWVWGSGKWGIIKPQELVGVKPDGDVGPKTLAAINSEDPYLFFLRLQDARREFIENIIKSNPSQKKFRQGWLNRINDFKFID